MEIPMVVADDLMLDPHCDCDNLIGLLSLVHALVQVGT